MTWIPKQVIHCAYTVYTTTRILKHFGIHRNTQIWQAFSRACEGISMSTFNALTIVLIRSLFTMNVKALIRTWLISLMAFGSISCGSLSVWEYEPTSSVPRVPRVWVAWTVLFRLTLPRPGFSSTHFHSVPFARLSTALRPVFASLSRVKLFICEGRASEEATVALGFEEHYRKVM